METQKLWKTAIYIRISKENGDDTLENQKNIIVDYLAEFNDIQICSIKIDDGYSGLNCARPAFQEMLQDPKKRRPSLQSIGHEVPVYVRTPQRLYDQRDGRSVKDIEKRILHAAQGWSENETRGGG